jgi:dihydroorotate dehydrogenase (fumarate)
MRKEEHMDMRHETMVAGMTLEHPLMNAAGMAKTVGDVERLARSASSAIVIGSYTMDPRMGYAGTTYGTDSISENTFFSLNALGLPNPGIEYLENYLPEMATIAHQTDKPLIVSIVGFSPQEYELLAECAFDGGADMVEINLGCPNVWEGHFQNKIPSFSPPAVAEVLHSVWKAGHRNPQKPICIKLSPFSDPMLLPIIARTISICPYIQCVTAVNSFPNAFAFDQWPLEENALQPLLSPIEGFGGLAGPALKPIGLGNVKQLRKSLGDWYSIIGVGGIARGKDILEYVAVGANAVQVATAYCQEGEQIFERLLTEYLETKELIDSKKDIPDELIG